MDTVFLDLSNVEASKGSGASEKLQSFNPGKYWIRCIQSEVKDNSAKTGKFLNCKFNFVDDELKGISFFNTFNFKHESAKAQEIGLQQIKSFLEAAGHGSVLNSPSDLVGLTACAQITKEMYKEQTQLKIKYFITQKPEEKSSGEALFS